MCVMFTGNVLLYRYSVHRMLIQDMVGSWTFQVSLTQNGSKYCYSFIIAVVICIIMLAGSFWGHFLFEERLKLPLYLGIFFTK